MEWATPAEQILQGHYVKTVFDRSSVNRLADAIRDKELIYWDTEKGAQLYNSIKKETDVHVVPANLNAGSYALSTLHDNARHESVSLSAHNVSNKDNTVKLSSGWKYWLL